MVVREDDMGYNFDALLLLQFGDEDRHSTVLMKLRKKKPRSFSSGSFYFSFERESTRRKISEREISEVVGVYKTNTKSYFKNININT